MQLDCLLRSMQSCVVGEYHAFVIVKADSTDHFDSYQELESVYGKRVSFIYQSEFSSFKSALCNALSCVRSNKLFFLVDDIIFTDIVDLGDICDISLVDYIPSLRLGLNIQHCYTSSTIQPLPRFISAFGDFLSWKWSHGLYDWNYPLSVDGNIFFSDEVRIWVNYLDYTSPNTFEHSLQVFNSNYFSKLGVCYLKSRLFNNPINCVQTDYSNLHGSCDTDYLLLQWKQSKRIDADYFLRFENSSPHQEVPLKLSRSTKLL